MEKYQYSKGFFNFSRKLRFHMLTRLLPNQCIKYKMEAKAESSI